MSQTRRIELPGHGPEDVVIDGAGRLITGLEDGRILRVDPHSGASEMLVNTGGRPLGLEVLADGRILICDSPNGLLRFDPESKRLETLVASDRGTALPFCSNVVAASNGDYYFSVSTLRYPFAKWRYDIVEGIPTGRLYRLATNGQLELLLDDILFANGVVLAPTGDYVLVAETAGHRILKRWLRGPNAGSTRTFCDLPGYPDNMSRDALGRIWIAIVTERNAALGAIHKLPRPVRSLVARLPQALQPKPKAVAWALACDDAGNIVAECKDEQANYAGVTGVAATHDTLYCSSTEENALLAFSL